MLLGQATEPIIAGILFDLRGGYTASFTVFVVLALACSLLVLNAKPPARHRAALAVWAVWDVGAFVTATPPVRSRRAPTSLLPSCMLTTMVRTRSGRNLRSGSR